MIKKAGFYIKYLHKYFRGTRKYTTIFCHRLKYRSEIASLIAKRTHPESRGPVTAALNTLVVIRAERTSRVSRPSGPLWRSLWGVLAPERRTDKPNDRSFHQREQTLRSRRRHSRPNMSIESTCMRVQSGELTKFIDVCVCIYIRRTSVSSWKKHVAHPWPLVHSWCTPN